VKTITISIKIKIAGSNWLRPGIRPLAPECRYARLANAGPVPQVERNTGEQTIWNAGTLAPAWAFVSIGAAKLTIVQSSAERA